MQKASSACFQRTLRNWRGKRCKPNATPSSTLRNEEAINDQALRRIQRDIDLAEARLQRPA